MLTKLQEMDAQLTAIESTAKKVEGEFHDSNQVCRYVATQHNNCCYYMHTLHTYMYVVMIIQFYIVWSMHCSYWILLINYNK